MKVKSEKEEHQEWSDLSIASAMKDQLDEPSLYSTDDIKEKFS